MKMSKLLHQGYIRYQCYALDIQVKEETTKYIHVVYEFKDVFPEELPGLAPQRESDFEIESIPGSQPFSKAPYCMSLSLKN